MSSNQTSAKTLYKNGMDALRKGDFLKAESSFAEVISHNEQDVDAWLKLGLTWAKMGRNEEASEALKMVLTLDPDNADAMHNLGITFLQSGKTAEGLEQIESAYRIKQDDEIAISLGDSYYKLRDYKKSAYYYLKAYQNRKYDAPLTHKLAISLYQDSDSERAVGLLIDLVLRFPKNKLYLTTLVETYHKLPHETFNAEAKKAIELCLKEENVRYRNLAPAWHSLLLLDPYYEKMRNFPSLEHVSLKELTPILASSFLCLGLQKIIVAKAPLEYILTHLRRYFLMHWKDSPSWPKDSLIFLTSLGVQSWFNDFVYFVSEEEKNVLAEMQAHLKNVIAAGTQLQTSDIYLLALSSCYTPLYELIPAESSLHMNSRNSDIMMPLIEAQLINPRIEADLIPKIPSFTEIEDATSKAVQAMYESRPYPRWTSANAQKISDHLRGMSRNIDILVAGCGTGQEPIMYAGILPETKITAVDLSRSSIAYGMRMADKMGFLPRIDFLHGDLMKVGEIGKKFDYIASSGVLHHLKEPEKGLAAILNVLKPGGKISISLYSKPARDYILNPAIEYIKEKGYTSSLDDIRQFRQDIFRMSPEDPRTLCTYSSDFFSLSECNDLLFHIQEHRYTFPMIKDMAERHGLIPYFVFLYPHKAKQFEEMFPNGSRSDLDLMAKFEDAYPDTFAEMYKVYFYRKGEDPAHPLDSLILLGAI